MREVLRGRLSAGPVLAGSRDLRDYLAAAMAHLPAEQMRALFLTAGNRLVSDEIVAWGSVSEVRLRHRHLVSRALELGADGLILAHNHPGGDPSPSQDDLVETRSLQALCHRLDIRLHDHLVVGAAGIRSLRSLGALT